MDYITRQAMTHANKILDQQEIIANNLANISTIGFKEQLTDQLLSPIKNSSTTYKYDQYYSSHNSYPYSNFSSGFLKHTNRNLDLSIIGNGWFVIQDNSSKNKEGYTRNGKCNIDNNGLLMMNNHPVIGRLGVIKIPKNKNIYISSNGNVNIIHQDKNHKESISVIERLKLVNPNTQNMTRGQNSIFYLNELELNKWNNKLPHDNTIKLSSGVLEESNVNLNENLINTILNERNFAIEMKIISNNNDNIQHANQLLNINY
ncbi:flagellar hook-basal body complex protein [Buchnera aphidicola (Formosaphis micheliae)]|uniref:flagellar hook-basal body complex protein n=1 Tax=Buchnera aphidicola TaxID=9 RepID=UPI0031B8A769